VRRHIVSMSPMLMVVWGLLLACDKESTRERERVDQVVEVEGNVIDITELERKGHPAAADLVAVIRADTERLALCADPVRHLVQERRSEIGFGRVGVIVDVVGKRGDPIRLATLDVEPMFALEQPGFSACVQSILRGDAPVAASADYSLRMRVHLCVRPERQLTASGKT